MSPISCLLCFQPVGTLGNEDTEDAYPTKYRNDILQCSKRLLSSEITTGTFEGNWNDKQNLFCLNCIKTSEELWLIDENIRKSKEELNNFIRIFTKQIFKSRVTVLSKKARMPTKAHQNTEKSVQFSCLFCFSSIDNMISLDNEIPYDYIHYKQIIFQSCCRLLSESVKGDSFDWTYSSKSRSPFCLNCFQSSEKLWSYEEKMTKITEELEECISSFSRTVLQSRLNTLYQKITTNDTETEKSFKSNGTKSSLEKVIFSETLSCPPISDINCIVGNKSCSESIQEQDVCKQHIVVETFKTEPLDGEEPFADSHFDIITCKSLSEGSVIEETPPLVIKTNYEQFKEIFSRKLFVSLEKLQVDINGKVIVAEQKNCKLRKRRAAVAAKALLCNETFQNTGSIEYTENGDDDYELSDNCAENFESDFEENEVKPKKNRSLKAKQKTKELSLSSEEKRKHSETFNCVVCETKFTIKKQLEKHSEETGHVNDRLFECNLCPSKFYRRCDLRIHNLKCHNTGARTCKVCGIVSRTFVLHEKHKKIHPRDSKTKELSVSSEEKRKHSETFNCVVCASKFTIKKQLEKHSEETGHVNHRSFECNLCPSKFYRRCDLRIHNLKGHNTGARTCEVCGIVSRTFVLHERHKKSHPPDSKTQDRKFKCDFCEKSYSKVYYLQEHMTQHNGKKYQCKICPASFIYRKGLVVHKSHHKSTEHKFQCQVCHRLYTSENSLSIHTRIHNDKFKCDSCEMDFEYFRQLVAHKIAVHGVESPYKCDDCQTTFTTKMDLNFHCRAVHHKPYLYRRHEGGPPYVCDVCGKSYTILLSLQSHITTKHTKTCEMKIALLAKNRRKSIKSKIERKRVKRNRKGSYPCQECGKIYTNVTTRNIHVKVIHTKELSFVCHICGNFLGDKQRLARHLLIHTGETHDCQFCGRGFSVETNLKRHIKRVHEQNKRLRRSYTKTYGIEPKHPTIFIESAEPVAGRIQTNPSNESLPERNPGQDQQSLDSNTVTGPYAPIESVQIPELSLAGGSTKYFEKLLLE